MQAKFNDITNTVEKWLFFDYDVIKINLKNIHSSIKLIKGVFDENLDVSYINEVSMLRLNMDWYQITKAALCKIYSKIQSDEVLITNYYMRYSGAKTSDEYLKQEKLKINFRHINYSFEANKTL